MAANKKYDQEMCKNTHYDNRFKKYSKKRDNQREDHVQGDDQWNSWEPERKWTAEGFISQGTSGSGNARAGVVAEMDAMAQQSRDQERMEALRAYRASRRA